jgi:hypothetical protein
MYIQGLLVMIRVNNCEAMYYRIGKLKLRSNNKVPGVNTDVNVVFQLD